jgi:uncharacterized membrane protein
MAIFHLCRQISQSVGLTMLLGATHAPLYVLFLEYIYLKCNTSFRKTLKIFKFFLILLC